MLSNVVRRARAHRYQITLAFVAALLTSRARRALAGRADGHLLAPLRRLRQAGREHRRRRSLRRQISDYLDLLPARTTCRPTSIPPAPLLNTRSICVVTETEAAQNIIISDRSRKRRESATIFANPLDPSQCRSNGKPSSSSTALSGRQKINITHIEFIEVDETPFPNAGSARDQRQGHRTPDPLKVSLLIDPEHVQSACKRPAIIGPFKMSPRLQLRDAIPEPSVDRLGMLGIARHRRDHRAAAANARGPQQLLDCVAAHEPYPLVCRDFFCAHRPNVPSRRPNCCVYNSDDRPLLGRRKTHTPGFDLSR